MDNLFVLEPNYQVSLEAYSDDKAIEQYTKEMYIVVYINESDANKASENYGSYIGVVDVEGAYGEGKSGYVATFKP